MRVPGAASLQPLQKQLTCDEQRTRLEVPGHLQGCSHRPVSAEAPENAVDAKTGQGREEPSQPAHLQRGVGLHVDAARQVLEAPQGHHQVLPLAVGAGVHHLEEGRAGCGVSKGVRARRQGKVRLGGGWGRQGVTASSQMHAQFARGTAFTAKQLRCPQAGPASPRAPSQTESTHHIRTQAPQRRPSLYRSSGRPTKWSLKWLFR